jgi:hypothetical protein
MTPHHVDWLIQNYCFFAKLLHQQVTVTTCRLQGHWGHEWLTYRNSRAGCYWIWQDLCNLRQEQFVARNPDHVCPALAQDVSPLDMYDIAFSEGDRQNLVWGNLQAILKYVSWHVPERQRFSSPEDNRRPSVLVPATQRLVSGAKGWAKLFNAALWLGFHAAGHVGALH